jgi:hypothetical protein
MYVRWQKRTSKRTKYRSRGSDGPGTVWSAVIVESARVDGKPRQKHVAYLGTFKQTRLEEEAGCLAYWEKITERLDRLGNRFSTDDRVLIETMLAEKVLPPAPEVYDDWFRDRETFLKGLNKMLDTLANGSRRRPLSKEEIQAKRVQLQEHRLHLQGRTRAVLVRLAKNRFEPVAA